MSDKLPRELSEEEKQQEERGTRFLALMIAVNKLLREPGIDPQMGKQAHNEIVDLFPDGVVTEEALQRGNALAERYARRLRLGLSLLASDEQVEAFEQPFDSPEITDLLADLDQKREAILARQEED